MHLENTADKKKLKHKSLQFFTLSYTFGIDRERIFLTPFTLNPANTDKLQ